MPQVTYLGTGLNCILPSTKNSCRCSVLVVNKYNNHILIVDAWNDAVSDARNDGTSYVSWPHAANRTGKYSVYNFKSICSLLYWFLYLFPIYNSVSFLYQNKFWTWATLFLIISNLYNKQMLIVQIFFLESQYDYLIFHYKVAWGV